MNNAQKFSGKADVYAAARPSYPKELFTFLKNKYHLGAGTVIADIASGTGKFTQPLVQMGCKVYAVEPNDDMRRQAELLLGGYENFISVNGSAEHTGLADHCVDFISAAQAFHWFDPARFAAECKRIIKPNSKVFILYNSRDEDAEITKRLSGLCQRLCPKFKGFSGGVKSNNVERFFNGGCERFTFPNDLYYDRDSFVKRMLSSSYAPREGDENYNSFITELNAVFDDFSDNDNLLMPNNAQVYVGCV